MNSRAALAAAVVAVVSLATLSGCIAGPEPTVAIFEVSSGGQFTIELATPELIEHAKGLLAGENLETVPQGVVVRGDSSVNAPWSWHIDPATFTFTNITAEQCDGIPQYVEDDALVSDSFCPWSARVIAVEGPDA
ncbi:hypothetical protein [Salinibacterium sp. NK8237]|uniref:BP74-related protein n=1 Tax=Salinibacterium sp. NK8237 TaxID=2792038 RepID=UPI0018CD26C5|nr:hypothetical protein [Salinibacterium sp. NK8237]MBH0129385.1 hypothetical protein [Salinibacterium sp. NK8237]